MPNSEASRPAAQILDEAIQALGGMESLQRIRSRSLTGKGTEFRSAEVQGRHLAKDTPTPQWNALVASPKEENNTVLRLA